MSQIQLLLIGLLITLLQLTFYTVQPLSRMPLWLIIPHTHVDLYRHTKILLFPMQMCCLILSRLPAKGYQR